MLQVRPLAAGAISTRPGSFQPPRKDSSASAGVCPAPCRTTDERALTWAGRGDAHASGLPVLEPEHVLAGAAGRPVATASFRSSAPQPDASATARTIGASLTRRRRLHLRRLRHHRPRSRRRSRPTRRRAAQAPSRTRPRGRRCSSTSVPSEVAVGPDPVERAGRGQRLGHVQLRPLQDALGDPERDPVDEKALPELERRGRRRCRAGGSRSGSGGKLPSARPRPARPGCAAARVGG